MSWICEYCSTVNEDSDTHCFVCDSERSRESVLEARREERETRRVERETTRRVSRDTRRVARDTRRVARSSRVAAGEIIIYRIANITGKVLCLGSIIVFLVFALIALFLRMSSGSLDDIIYNLWAMLTNMFDNFCLMFYKNIRIMINRVLGNNLGALLDNFVYVFKSKEWKYELLGDNIEEIANRFYDFVVRLFGLLSMFFTSLFDRIRVIIENIGSIIEKSTDHF